jgi:MYXO-CTERM domain-containing protein
MMKTTRGGHTARWVSALAGMALLAGASPANALPRGFEAEVYVEGLRFPVRMAIVDDATILVTEKFGTIRLVKNGVVRSTPLLTVEPKTQNEAGLLDIVLSPDFDETGFVYFTYTPAEDPDHIYLSRFVLDGEQARMDADPFMTFPSRRQTDRHYAATMKFAPDGHFFIAIGDLRSQELSQDTTHLAGSVLRYTADFEIPAENPLGPTSPIYAWGLRNPFGIDISPEGDIYAVGNGDDVADELNLIEAGKNYGWPLVEGYCDNFPKYEPCEADLDLTDPIYEFRTVIGPTDVLHYSGALMPGLEGHLFVTGWHSRRIHHLAWNEDRTRMEELGVFFEAPTSDAGFVAITEAPDGAIFVMESGLNAGTIYRIVPPEAIKEPSKVVKPGDGDESERGCSAATSPVPPRGALTLIVLLGVAAVRGRRR